MGELHLDVYIERMKREYGIQLSTGVPQVAYRETITRSVPFDYTHKKQSGGAGQYGRVIGILEPLTHPEDLQEKSYKFIDRIKGGVIPAEYISSCDKGFQECLQKGGFIGFPVVGVKVTIHDGNTHPVDSSDPAFRAAAIGAFRQAYAKAHAIILEPLMRVGVETPSEYQGNVFASINQRRGVVFCTTEDEYFSRIEAEVPLVEMFGYSTVLRSISQGKADFTMEFARYGRAPQSLADELTKRYKTGN